MTRSQVEETGARNLAWTRLGSALLTLLWLARCGSGGGAAVCVGGGLGLGYPDEKKPIRIE